MHLTDCNNAQRKDILRMDSAYYYLFNNHDV